MISNLRQLILGPGAFRLFLASMVFIYHISSFAVGTAAVYLFFCLSGFWIYRIWYSRYVLTENKYITYAISRSWRLLPTFALVSMIVIIFELLTVETVESLKAAASWPHFIMSNMIIFGYNALPRQPIVPAWSLDIECQFYIVAPIIIYLFNSRLPNAPLVVIAILISLGSVLLNGGNILLSYLIFFVIGIAFAHSGKTVSGHLGAYSVIATALLVIVTFASPLRGIIIGGATHGPLFVYNGAANILIALLLTPYAFYTISQQGSRWDGMFADLSYIVYLLHWAAFRWIDHVGGSPLHRLPHMIAGWIAVFSISYLIWRLYDKPINRLRSAWVSRRIIEKRNRCSAPTELTTSDAH